MWMLLKGTKKSVAALRSGSGVFQHISVTGALLLNTLQCNCAQNLKIPWENNLFQVAQHRNETQPKEEPC